VEEAKTVLFLQIDRFPCQELEKTEPFLGRMDQPLAGLLAYFNRGLSPRICGEG